MKRSTDRILTTHAGSLPRPQDLLDAMRRQGAGPSGGREGLRGGAAPGRGRHRQAAGRSRHRRRRRRRIRQAELRQLRQRAARRLRAGHRRRGRTPWAESREANSFPEFYAATARGLAAEPQGLHRADRLSRPGAVEARHRQPQGRARGRQASPRPSCRRSRPPAPRTGSATPITRPTRNICSRSRTRCARNTRRSSRRDSCCRSTIRNSSRNGSRSPTSRSRNTASGRRAASPRSIMRCATFRPRRCATTPATASIWARASTTWSSRTSSTSC